MLANFKIPSPLLLKRILAVMTVLFAVAWLMSVVEMFMEHSGVNYQEKDRFVNRHLYRVSDLFFDSSGKVVQGKKGKQDSLSSGSSTDVMPLTSWSLTALYHEGDEGFAVVEVSGKSHFLNLKETLLGYTLSSIKDKSAFLNRGGKHYKLTLDIKNRIFEHKNEPIKDLAPEKLNVASLQKGVLSRADINRRMKQPDLIWKDIKISIYRKGGDIAGFIVRSVKHNSIFHHLGLKRGDIIISADGNTLNSLERVQELYKNIDKMTSLVLGVKRAGKIEELTYEIK